MFNVNTSGVDIDQYVDFYFLWGVNITDDREVFYRLRSHLKERFGGISVADRLFSVAGFTVQSKSNTFLLSMGGFLYDKVGDRNEYKRRLDAPDLTGEDLIDIYLDAAFEGFVASVGRSERYAFDTVLYALASENRISGRASDVSRLAGLCHYPEDDVQRVVEYMTGTGMLEPAMEDGSQTFRLKHEKLSDRVLKSDKLQVHSRAVVGIRFLSENRISTAKLTRPLLFPNSHEKPWVSAGSISVYIFVLFGIARLLQPDAVFVAVHFLTDVALAVGVRAHFIVSGYQEYYAEAVYYAPHFMAHVAWVSYIDRMNRSFIQNVAKGWYAFAGQCLAPIGCVLGLSVSYTPELFVVPIVAVGILFGMLVMLISRTASFGGQSKIETWYWGVRSIINVVVVLAFAYFLDLAGLLSSNNQLIPYFAPTTTVLAVVWAEGLAMLWFWTHIYPEQNNRNVWAANLAMYDKGRIYGR
ncbi:hypothetical protein Q9L58_010772 [Maublancomyces gigas]|uniref:Uncharacterized protein n=1 Tax=Discina gigas TaxID=1032678 RepID=A0ABR3G350_9PEZI